MKRILIGLAAFALVAATATGLTPVKTSAATTIADNYGAYVVASSDSAESDGWTTYYTKIGDGNGIMTFDLLSANTFGYFGLICGDSSSVNDMDSLKDYVLFGEDVKTTLNVNTLDFAFEAGYTYRATFNASQKMLSLEEKAIGAADEEYVSVFETQTTFSSSNVIGMAALSDGYDSATVIIDNLKISDLKGKSYYVNNTFDNGSVKDGSMKVGCYDTATDATGSAGGVYLHKDALCTVRFVDESGELLATQKVCWYGSATAPTAPKKAGYDFVGWSENLHNVRKDMLVYPLYEESKPVDSSLDTSSDVADSVDASSDVADSVDTSSSAGLLDCLSTIGGMSVFAILTLAGVALTLKKREDK